MITVKEQRVDGSWCVNVLTHLRCTLQTKMLFLYVVKNISQYLYTFFLGFYSKGFWDLRSLNNKAKIKQSCIIQPCSLNDFLKKSYHTKSFNSLDTSLELNPSFITGFTVIFYLFIAGWLLYFWIKAQAHNSKIRPPTIIWWCFFFIGNELGITK